MPALLDGATRTPANTAAAYLIVIAASSGGLKAIRRVITDLPPRLNGAIIFAQHRSPVATDILAEILATRTSLQVETAGHGQSILANRLYVARPDLHLTIGPDRRFYYSDGSRIKDTLSAADPLLASAARVFGSRLIAVVLTGRGSDAADGVRTVRAGGGIVMAQDPQTAEAPEMPEAAIATGAVHLIMPLAQIGLELRHVIEALEVEADDLHAAGQEGGDATVRGIGRAAG